MTTRAEEVTTLVKSFIAHNGFTAEDLKVVCKVCMEEAVHLLVKLAVRDAPRYDPGVETIIHLPCCVLCGRPISGKVYYQGGMPDRPVHRDCQISIRRGNNGGT